MCRFFGFKSCTIITFMIVLKLLVWEKSDSWVKCQSECRIFKLWYMKNYWSYEVDFLHAGTYLLKLQIDYVISYEWYQAYPKRLKKLKEV